MKYYTTEDIIKITQKTRASILVYARNHIDEFTVIGEGTNRRYLWTEENIEKYKNYLKNAKVGRPEAVSYEPSDDYDTIYHRMIRAKKKGNEKLYNECRQILEQRKKRKIEFGELEIRGE